MSLRNLLVLPLSIAATQCALAQSPPPPGPPLPPEPIEMRIVASMGLGSDAVVQGAPYCADAIHESVQPLADGNRIVQRQSSRLCRDGQGRTRQEVAVGERRRIYLRDPVANESWLLDPDRKSAFRLPARGTPMEGMAHRPPGWEDRMESFSREMREWGREMRDWGRDLGDRVRGARAGASAPLAPVPPVPPVSAVPPIPPVEPGVAVRNVRIVVDGVEAAGMHPPPGVLPPTVAWRARVHAPRGPGVVTMLPAETVEGVRADGKRTTWTLPAGRIGNEKPIVTVREVWSSPELNITLRSRETDPLAGEEHYRVQNLVRGEPDPALFRVPTDYRKAGGARTP